MPLPPIDTVALFTPERAALLALLDDLDPAEWWLPTVCGDWTVHDVAVHVLGADVNVLSRDRDQFRGPPGSDPATDLGVWANLVAFIDRRNAEWVNANRRLSPRLLCQFLRFTGELVDSVWPAMDLNAIGPPVTWAGQHPMPLWMHVAREYTERWTHQQHIREAVRRPGLTERRWMHPVLDAFARAIPVALESIAAPEGSGAGLVITGDSGGEWWAQSTLAGWMLTGTRPESVRATVELDQETAWRLLTRGIGPAMARERATVTGDAAIVDALLNMVSMIVRE